MRGSQVHKEEYEEKRYLTEVFLQLPNRVVDADAEYNHCVIHYHGSSRTRRKINIMTIYSILAVELSNEHCASDLCAEISYISLLFYKRDSVKS